ncbi:hypothetical protein PFICI_11118 [Pestalotiopsis fici W106-1]|uniref:2EXR domain-containing protein n=1 Tax=Pestalotiopsis fici (strain W106-1 / CGMCC3.15140) TaxID=1229662 RepID=W3WTY4_PESFW|nr:uncharacterized protein PFICI_11118 [Pestalotiopsis fici W106-1]ETS77244.1 hypothetical protein PFICI_11118 [Pestalotiopsis fici W106-1]
MALKLRLARGPPGPLPLHQASAPHRCRTYHSCDCCYRHQTFFLILPTVLLLLQFGSNGLRGLLLAIFLAFVLLLPLQTTSEVERYLVIRQPPLGSSVPLHQGISTENSQTGGHLAIIQAPSQRPPPHVLPGHHLYGRKQLKSERLYLYMKADSAKPSMDELAGRRSVVSADEDGLDVTTLGGKNIVSTPQQRSQVLDVPSGSFTPSYPDPRSGTRGRLASELDFDPRSPSLKRLKTATSSGSVSPLENSRDIHTQAHELSTTMSGMENHDDEIPDSPASDDNSKKRQSRRRAGQIIPRNQGHAVAKVAQNTSRRKRASANAASTRFPRRSPRLAKPLTEFPKYSHLPAEIKLMIWKSAQVPRLVYIRNRAALGFVPKVQTKPPKWLMTDRCSLDVAVKNYVNMFSLHGGFHCVRHQFSSEDKRLVRFLAVQNESPHLPPSTRPCWETLSDTFPNVETLYLLKSPLTGDITEGQALIRAGADDREVALQKRFAEWKKGAGKNKALTTLDFAIATNKEPDTIKAGERYRYVEGRETGLAKDIIVD